MNHMSCGLPASILSNLQSPWRAMMVTVTAWWWRQIAVLCNVSELHGLMLPPELRCSVDSQRRALGWFQPTRAGIAVPQTMVWDVVADVGVYRPYLKIA